MSNAVFFMISSSRLPMSFVDPVLRFVCSDTMSDSASNSSSSTLVAPKDSAFSDWTGSVYRVVVLNPLIIPANVDPILPAPTIPTVLPNSSRELYPSTSGRIHVPLRVSLCAIGRCR